MPVSAAERKYRAIEQERQQLAAKANELIQKTRYSLSVEEQKIILYTLSKISKDDVALHDMVFDVVEFKRLCGIEGEAHTRIKETFKKLQEIDKDTESCVHWFSKIHMKKRSGKVIVRFHEDLVPYILQLKNCFTSFSIYPTLAMKSKYSIRLYELLKSYEAIGDWWFTVEDFQKKLDANYALFADLRRKVIDTAVKEINLYSDLDVSWKPIKEGRKVVKIAFCITHKPPYYEEQAKRYTQKELEGKTHENDKGTR